MKKEKPNLDIRMQMMINDITGVEIAEVLGIHPTNLSHLLNDKQLNTKWHNAILNSINTVIIRKALTKREVTA